MRKLRVRPRQVADVFLTYALLLIVSIIFLFPCLWLVLSCFSATGSIYSTDFFRRPIRWQVSFRCLPTLTTPISTGLPTH